MTYVTIIALVSCMLTLEASSLSLFYSLLQHTLPTRMFQPCLNLGIGRPPKILKSSSLTTTFSDKIEWPTGGGVAIYCKDSLQSSVLLSRSVPQQFELLLLKIHLSKNKSLTVSACYRPPSATSGALDTICKLIAPPSIFRARAARRPKLEHA